MNTIDVYQFFKNHPAFNKLIGDDYLFVEYKCPIEADQFKLWSENDFFSYIISGKKDWTSLHQKVSTNEGEAVYIRKGVYNTKQYFEVDYCVMLFFVTDDFIRRFMNEFSNLSKSTQSSHPQIFEIDVDDTLQSLFTTVFNYFKKGGNLPKELIELKFKELFYNIVANPKNNLLSSFFSSVNNQEKTDLNYLMMKNFHSDLTLEEYANLSGRSLSSFKRDFKQHFNETPRKWINSRRLEYAKTLLENSNLNVSEVCYESGFKNTSHFNTAFKEAFHLPPNKFKNQLQ